MPSTSELEKYGLTELPFNGHGVDTGEYDFIVTEGFDSLVKWIDSLVISQKTELMSLTAPQGAGKSATLRALKKHFENNNKSTIFSSNLRNISSANLTKNLLESLKEDKICDVEQAILDSINKDTLADDLIKYTLNAILSSLSGKEVGIWIIDEMDVISGNLTDTEMRGFWHFFTSLFNEIVLAMAKIPMEDRPAFVVLFANTNTSYKDLDEAMKKHGAFAGAASGRLWKPFIIKYGKPEIKKIVTDSRFEGRRTQNFSGDKFFPFTEQVIEDTYDLVVNWDETDSVQNFRLFERTLFQCMMNGLSDKNFKIFDKDSVTKAFQEVVKTETPIILSGGLNEGNIINGIKTIQPFAVDVNSGVESEPGIKDESKVSKLFNVLKNTENNFNLFNNYYIEER